MVGAQAREHVLGGYVSARIGQGGADFLAHHRIDRGFFTIERTHRSADDLARRVVKPRGQTPVDTALLLAKSDSDGFALAHGTVLLVVPIPYIYDTVIQNQPAPELRSRRLDFGLDMCRALL